MKNKLRVWLVAALLCGLLTACGHQHTWLDASCQAPKTCADCGVTEGVALAHSWQEASCQAPKTCAKCGSTEGAALAHEFGQWGAREQEPSGQWIRSRSCENCGARETQPANAPTIRTDLGSAGSPDGTTLIISVFADERTTGWDFTDPADVEARELMRTHMASATEWLTQQIGAYGAESRFIYDWEENPDLCYTYDFGEALLVRPDMGGYWDQEAYVKANIPAAALKEKYQAQNIIYMFYFNTDETNTVNSWSLGDLQDLEIEIINVFVRDDLPGGFYYMPASSLAHEIMHCFGAYDLYYASGAITQAYVNHCRLSDSQDIMYTTSLGATIPQLFTRLDAYYLGLVDSCDEVTQWGLGTSAFFE